MGIGHIIPFSDSPSEEKGTNIAGYKDVKVVDVGEKMDESGEGSTASEKRKRDIGLENRPGGDINREEEYTATWHDVALSIAAELMDKARAQVREMGYTTSAVSVQSTRNRHRPITCSCQGIARNKFLAKARSSL